MVSSQTSSCFLQKYKDACVLTGCVFEGRSVLFFRDSTAGGSWHSLQVTLVVHSLAFGCAHASSLFTMPLCYQNGGVHCQRRWKPCHELRKFLTLRLTYSSNMLWCQSKQWTTEYFMVLSSLLCRGSCTRGDRTPEPSPRQQPRT